MSQAAEALHTRTEVLKLARLLGREPGGLAYLERLDPAELRALRDGVTETLYGANDSSLRKLAAASRLLPTGLVATLAQRAFGPLLSARLAGLLDQDRAVDVAVKLPLPFLADVAVEMDPRRASALIAGIPPKVIAQITAELAARHEYVTMGCFVGYLGEDALPAALGAMDDAAVLQVALVLEEKSQLPRLVERLGRERMAGIARAAADDGLWLEALDLLSTLPTAQRREMIEVALALDDAAREEILAAVTENDLSADVLAIAQRDPALRSQLAGWLDRT